MDVTIRAVEASDVPTLDILRRQSLEEAFRGTYDRSDFAGLVATPDDDLRNQIDSDRYVVKMTETEVTAVSYGVFDTEDCNLAALYTSPDYQREGFGTTLLDSLVSGVDCTTISTVAPATATPFFEAYGFESVGETQWNGLSGHTFEYHP